jgi:hypothetical protein
MKETTTQNNDYQIMGIKLTGEEYSFINSHIVKFVNNNISEWNRRTAEERQDYIKISENF